MSHRRLPNWLHFRSSRGWWLVAIALLGCGIATTGGFASEPTRPAGAAIGVVDMVTVAAFHPLMASFDFVRLGFHRATCATHVASQTDVAALQQESANLAREMTALDENKARLLRAGPATDPARLVQHDMELQRLHQSGLELTNRITQIRFVIDNPDLTSFDETRKLFALVEQESSAAIAAVAASAGVDLVLNRSLPQPLPEGTTSAAPQTAGLPWLHQNLYYGLLHAPSTLQTPGDAFADNPVRSWLALSRHPDVVRRLPLSPHPLVLSGGIDLTAPVVGHLLRRYGVAEPVMTAIVKTLSEPANR